MTFGNWLRQKLKEKGISQAELARRVGYSATHIGNILRDYSGNTKDGIGRPSRVLAVKIAEALNEDIDETLLVAGYAPISEGNSLSLEVGEGVEIRFQDFVPEEEREEVRKAVRRIVAGIRAEQEEDRPASGG